MLITSLIEKIQIPGFVTRDEITLFSKDVSLLALFSVGLISYHYLS